MSLSVMLAQIQMPPQYHPSYSLEPKSEAGRPLSKLKISRKAKLLAICREFGEAQHLAILEEIRKTDPRIHKDDCRKILDELVTSGQMTKRTVISSGKKCFYSAKPE